MPYARKRSFASRKRSYSRGKSSYKRRRKMPMRRRFVATRKRFSVSRKRSVKKVTGVFSTLGNRSIPAKKLVSLPWMQEQQSEIKLNTSQGGKVYIASEYYSCASGCFNVDRPQVQLSSDLAQWTSPKWDQYAAKYQRCRLLTSHWKFEFSQNSQNQGLNAAIQNQPVYGGHNQIIFGVYLSDVRLPPPPSFLCDFEKLKLAGNLKYKKVNQFGPPCVITMDVDYPKCIQSDSFYTKHMTWTLEAMGNNGAVSGTRRDANFPQAQNLFLIPFVCYTSSQGVDDTDTKVRIRVSCVKKVVMDRPVQNISFLNVAAQDNYPPVKADLPVNFVPRPLNP